MSDLTLKPDASDADCPGQRFAPRLPLALHRWVGARYT
jgi:hypothetical protein